MRIAPSPLAPTHLHPPSLTLSAFTQISVSDHDSSSDESSSTSKSNADPWIGDVQRVGRGGTAGAVVDASTSRMRIRRDGLMADELAEASGAGAAASPASRRGSGFSVAPPTPARACCEVPLTAPDPTSWFTVAFLTRRDSQSRVLTRGHAVAMRPWRGNFRAVRSLTIALVCAKRK